MYFDRISIISILAPFGALYFIYVGSEFNNIILKFI